MPLNEYVEVRFIVQMFGGTSLPADVIPVSRMIGLSTAEILSSEVVCSSKGENNVRREEQFTQGAQGRESILHYQRKNIF